MSGTIIPEALSTFVDANGKPLAGGSVHMYIPNTSTPKNTWQDVNLTILNTNPIILNSSGQAAIWGSGQYRQVVYDQFNNLIWDAITEDTSGALIGNMNDNTYLSGSGFTPGTTTQLTLSKGPGSVANVWVFFDSLFQTPDGWSLNFSTNIITFNAAIPVGVQEVNIKVGSTIPIGTPGSGTVTDSSVANGTRLYNRITDWLDIKDFGVTGNGTTDDSAAMSSAFSTANGREIFFPAATYYIGSNVTAQAGSRAYFQTGVTFTGSGNLQNVNVVYETGESTATAGSVMKIDRLWETPNTGYSATALGGYWPTVNYNAYAFSKTYISTDGSAGAASPAHLAYAVNNGSPADVVGGLDVAHSSAASSNLVVFGRNIIATNETSSVNSKLVGLEIDVQPSPGSTLSGQSAGIYLNAFNLAVPGPAMQLGGIGGTFNNGIIINGLSSSAAAFSMQAGSVAAYGIHLANGGISQTAIYMAPQQGVGWTNGSYLDSDNSNTVNIYSPNQTRVMCSGTSEGTTIMAIYDGSGTIAPTIAFVARGASGNSSNCAIRINANSINSRSVNAGGTINSSGADYAEYELKRDDCGIIAKGQIVGFDSDGKLTDKFSLSIRFGVKSTSPNIVGGDDWHTEIGEPPRAPEQPLEPRGEPVKQDHIAHYSRFKKHVEFQYESDMKTWNEKLSAYKEAKSIYDIAKSKFDSEYADWQEKHETVRQKMDRIAYCGKVPVNVIGARPGQYLVPVVANGDSIAVQLVDDSLITFEQYRLAVGRVSRVLADGRAEAVVKPI